LQEIQEKMPADPFEAELLMMAAAVASGPESEDEDTSRPNKKDTCQSPPVETKSVIKSKFVNWNVADISLNDFIQLVFDPQ
jgi:hypothetical protein